MTKNNNDVNIYLYEAKIASTWAYVDVFGFDIEYDMISLYLLALEMPSLSLHQILLRTEHQKDKNRQ